MEEDECLVRSRKVPRIPAFPDLGSAMDGESNHEEHPQGNGDSHMTSNGEDASPSWTGGHGQRKDIDLEATRDVWRAERSVDSTTSSLVFTVSRMH